MATSPRPAQPIKRLQLGEVLAAQVLQAGQLLLQAELEVVALLGQGLLVERRQLRIVLGQHPAHPGQRPLLGVGQMPNDLDDRPLPGRWPAAQPGVIDLTGSGLGVTGAVIAEIAPVLLLAPLAGAVIDRLPRVGVMIASDLWRMALAGLLPLVDQHLAAVYAVAFGLAAGGVFFNPAASSVLPSLVDDDELVAANSGLWSAAVISQIALAPLAGALVATVGVGPRSVAGQGHARFLRVTLPRGASDQRKRTEAGDPKSPTPRGTHQGRGWGTHQGRDQGTPTGTDPGKSRGTEKSLPSGQANRSKLHYRSSR